MRRFGGRSGGLFYIFLLIIFFKHGFRNPGSIFNDPRCLVMETRIQFNLWISEKVRLVLEIAEVLRINARIRGRFSLFVVWVLWRDFSFLLSFRRKRFALH
jgi:hypothetical protein